MNKNRAWNTFAGSGNIRDYLLYSALSGVVSVSTGQKEDKNEVKRKRAGYKGKGGR